MAGHTVKSAGEDAISEFDGRKIAVLGFGISGRAAHAQLTAQGASVRVIDDGRDGAGKIATTRRTALAADGSEIAIEHSDEAHADDFDIVVASPGWRPSTPFLQRAAAIDVPVWSEVELAWRLRANKDAPWLAVTGTNGKTTTVEMLAAILGAAGENVAAAGNVGRPLVDAVSDPAYTVFSVELSSFQLHYTHTMTAQAAACLNIAADHIDWHGSMEAYAADKGRIFRGAQRACVYNVADSATDALVRQADVAEGCRAVGFTLGAPERGQVGVVGDILIDRAFGEQRLTTAVELATVDDLVHLAGPDGRVAPHIVANALAASALARAHGVSAEAIRHALRGFGVGPHRLQTVGRLDGVSFVDDSKATNAHATAASLNSFPEGTVVWIAGGLAKGAEFDDLIRDHGKSLRAAILIGQNHDELQAALATYAPAVPIVETDGDLRAAAVMDAAVTAAIPFTRPGDTVLLAPASASMDQFTDYAQRGNVFAEAARTAGAR